MTMNIGYEKWKKDKLYGYKSTSSNKENISTFLLFFEFTIVFRCHISIGSEICCFDDVPTAK